MITTVVLAVVLITGSAWLLGAQLRCSPWARWPGCGTRLTACVYRRLIRPRLGPPARTEAEAPPRFAQGGGHGLRRRAASSGYAAGAATAGIVFTALALAAAFLNAAFDFCLGCQVYLFIQRNLRVRPSA